MNSITHIKLFAVCQKFQTKAETLCLKPEQTFGYTQLILRSIQTTINELHYKNNATASFEIHKT